MVCKNVFRLTPVDEFAVRVDAGGAPESVVLRVGAFVVDSALVLERKLANLYKMENVFQNQSFEK